MGYEAHLLHRSAPIVVVRPHLVLETLAVAVTNLSWGLGRLDPIADYLNDPEDRGDTTTPPATYGFARLADDYGFTVDRFTTHGVTLLDFDDKLSRVWPFLWDCLAYGVDTETSWTFEGEDGDQWTEQLVPGRHTTHGPGLDWQTGGGYVTDRRTQAESDRDFHLRYGRHPDPSVAQQPGEPDWPVVIERMLADHRPQDDHGTVW